MKNTVQNLGIMPELRSFSLFSDTPDALIEQLCENASVRFTEHRESLFQVQEKADHFFLVLSGAYKLAKPSPLGENTILHFSSPGDVIAAFIMAQPIPQYPLSAISMGPSRALKIPRKNYVESWKNNMDLIFKIQNLLTTRMISLQNQKALAKSPLQAKVATLLIELIDRQPDDNKHMIVPIPLTRKEIADTVGASIESIIRIMSDWSKKGFISTNEQTITIIKAEKIIELMHSEN